MTLGNGTPSSLPPLPQGPLDVHAAPALTTDPYAQFKPWPWPLYKLPEDQPAAGAGAGLLGEPPSWKFVAVVAAGAVGLGLLVRMLRSQT